MSSVIQASSRIAFSSDQQSSADLDVYVMQDDGTNQTRLTDAPSSGLAHRTSYSYDGRRVLYDVAGDIWVARTVGSPSPQNLTAFTEGDCSGDEVCEDADAGPKINTAGDFLIVFTKETEEDLTSEIYIATYNVGTGALSHINPLTSDDGGSGLIDYHPAWCGDDHVIWSRESNCVAPASCELTEKYFWELCIVEVSQTGPVGDPTCFLDWTSAKANQHPSCNESGDMVAFAQSDGDIKSGDFYIEQPHDICTMDLTAEDPEDAVECNTDFDTDSDVDENHPTWSPAGTQIAFASNKPNNGPSDVDYEIWKVNDDFSGTPVPLTDNTDVDDEPDWGAAVLP
jgi:Tol biopolymer transport system component